MVFYMFKSYSITQEIFGVCCEKCTRDLFAQIGISTYIFHVETDVGVNILYKCKV